MTRKLLDCIEITTAEQCNYSVIWLHGLGASGHDFEPIVPALHLLQRPGVRFLFPHAPVRPIAVNGGAAMRAWYDISSLDFETRQQDSQGIKDSAQAIEDLIENEIQRGVAANRITLAGFSQGGAIALYTGLTSQHRLGGILALSCYLPEQSEVLPALTDAHREVPIFMGHGTQDEVIQYKTGEQSRTVLEESNVSLEWHSYSIAHSVSGDEVEDISAWLKRLFGM